MRAAERIMMIRLMEKMKEYPEYTKSAGITAETKGKEKKIKK